MGRSYRLALAHDHFKPIGEVSLTDEMIDLIESEETLSISADFIFRDGKKKLMGFSLVRSLSLKADL